MPSALDPEQVARFERLALPWASQMLRLARYLTKRDAEAEDLVQETMIKAMRSMDSFRDGTDIKAWLTTILRRTWIDMGRSAARRKGEVPLDEALDQAANAPAVATDAASYGRHDPDWQQPAQLMEQFGDQEVIDALKALPEDIRWTLLLVDVEQMDQLDAASVLGVPVGTVKSRAHRGRAMLRDRLYEVAQKRGWIEQIPRKEERHA